MNPEWIDALRQLPLVYVALAGSFLSAGATGVGAIPILFTDRISDRLQGSLLGFGAGVMLAATSFSLILPGIEAAQLYYSVGEFTVALIIALGILLGGSFLRLCDTYAPHEHFIKGPEGSVPANLSRIWLFIVAITLHNLPEGLAVGVGFGGDDLTNAVPLAIGIGLQNMPEGLVVALALLTENYSRRFSLGVATLTGLLEPVGGVLGFLAVTLSQALLPWGLAFAAGAMLYVISHEIIPESHRNGYSREATAGVMIGFVIMMILDVSLG